MEEQPFRLLDLPPEIRYQIYEHYLFPDGGKNPWTPPILGVYLGREPYEWWTVSTELLRVCRRISLEARMVFYQNFILYTGPAQIEDLYTFLQMIGKENRRNLRHLQIEMPDKDVINGELSRPNRRRGQLLGLLNIFDLLSHGHSLGHLLLRFQSHEDLTAFYESERAMERFHKLKNIVKLEIKIGPNDSEIEGTPEQQKYLKETTQKLKKQAQAPDEESPAIRRARKQVEEMRGLLAERDDMVAWKRAAEGEVEYFNERSRLAVARSAELGTKIVEVEKSIEELSLGQKA